LDIHLHLQLAPIIQVQRPITTNTAEIATSLALQRNFQSPCKALILKAKRKKLAYTTSSVNEIALRLYPWPVSIAPRPMVPIQPQTIHNTMLYLSFIHLQRDIHKDGKSQRYVEPNTGKPALILPIDNIRNINSYVSQNHSHVTNTLSEKI
jgi:hypothetical protein